MSGEDERIGLDQITVRLTRGDGGWWTSQVMEAPAAISQGLTAMDAAANVLDALFAVLVDVNLLGGES